MIDGRINNSGTIGNKGGGWPSIDRKLWQACKNKAIQEAYKALSEEGLSEFKQKVILKLIDKINIDDSDRSSIATFLIREHGDSVIQTEQVAETGSTGQE